MTPTPDTIKQAEEVLKPILRQEHYECEDGFYSCPKHPDYFGNASKDTCYCEVENSNPKIINAVALALQSAREEGAESVRQSTEEGFKAMLKEAEVPSDEYRAGYSAACDAALVASERIKGKV